MTTDTRWTADAQSTNPEAAAAGHWHRVGRDGARAACGQPLLPDPDLWARLPRGARPCPRCGADAAS